MSHILTVPQAAEKLQMSVDVVREYLRAGKLPGRKVGKAWRVLESDLERWVSAGGGEPRGRYVSARGLLKKYIGAVTSAAVTAAKRAEAELEVAKLCGRAKKSRRPK